MPVIRVEVAYALHEEQALVLLDLEEGATAWQAVEGSGLLARFPDIDPAHASLGIFGRVTPPDTRLRDGDRVEIYRPLTMDPNEARRLRAKQLRERKSR